MEKVPEKYDNDGNLKRSYRYQFMVSVSATLLMMSAGTMSGWSSPSLPKLMANDSHIPVSSDDSSWLIITSIAGTMVGTVPGAVLMDRFGRKNGLLACAIPVFTGWILIGTANSIITLYFGKFFLGLSYGWAVSIIPAYLGEIASEKVRGSLSTLVTIMSKLGILYVYCIGPNFSISTTAWLCMIPITCFVATFMWLPESPYYLIGSNRPENAKKSLSKLRCRTDVELELDRITAAVEFSKLNKGTLKELFTKNNRYRLLLIIGLALSYQLTGFQAVLSYSETIFRRMGSSLEPSNASIIYAAVQLVAAGCSSFAMDSWGRRPLLLSSLTGVATCNTIIGLYFMFIKLGYDVSNISWLPVATLMTYTIFFSIGMASVPYITLGEIFPKNIKSIAAMVFIITGTITAFIVVKCFQIVTDRLGSEYAFLGLAAFCYIFLPIFWIFLPETKGKTLDMILKEFNNRKI